MIKLPRLPNRSRVAMIAQINLWNFIARDVKAVRCRPISKDLSGHHCVKRTAGRSRVNASCVGDVVQAEILSASAIKSLRNICSVLDSPSNLSPNPMGRA